VQYPELSCNLTPQQDSLKLALCRGKKQGFVQIMQIDRASLVQIITVEDGA